MLNKNKMIIQKTIIKIFSIICVFTTFLVLPVLAKELPSLSSTTSITSTFANKGGFSTDPGMTVDSVIGNIIKYFLSFLGVIFLGLLIYGGFTWMRARGDDSAVSNAKETMINAITGLIIVLGSYAATAWVVKNLATSTLN